MGYSIYYDRAFIRVGNQYIPLVNSGASNTAEYAGGRRVPEKSWEVLNWKRRDWVLFSESEIRAIAQDYEQNHQENGMSFKSRSKPFAPSEFEQWIVRGMKSSYTIEEYISFKNGLDVVDYPEGITKRWRHQPFSTEEELMSIIKQFKLGHEFHITFDNKRHVNRPSVRKCISNKNRAYGHPQLATMDNEKLSVMDRITISRDKTKPTGQINTTPDRKKSNDTEL